jgi:hypothetical protein
MKPEAIRQWEDAIYHRAIDGLPRAKDGSFDEVQAIAAIAALLAIDIDREKERRAARIIKDRSRPDSTDPGGLLVFDGRQIRFRAGAPGSLWERPCRGK